MRVAFAGQVPKHVAFPDDIEDAMAFAPEAHRVAISDGASESYDSRSWAQLLARRFVADPDVGPGWLNAAVEEYRELSSSADLSWSRQAAFDRGSFSSLLGIEYFQGENWLKVHCVGDSVAVLIDVREACKYTFYYNYSGLFSQRPDLLSTVPACNTAFTAYPFFASHKTSWRLDAGAPWVVLCMTDAMGEWVLRQHECHQPVWNELLALEVQTDLDVLVAEARESRGMRVDDVTLVRLSFDD